MFLLPKSPPNRVQFISGLVVISGPINNLSVLVSEIDGHFHLPAENAQPSETSIETAAKLLFDLTGVIARCGSDSTGFVDLVLGILHDNPNNRAEDGIRTIYAIYGTFLPQKPSGNFISINDTRLDDNMKQLINEIGRKL